MLCIPEEIKIYITKKALHLELYEYFELQEKENKALRLKIQKLLKRIKYIRSIFFNLRHLLSKIISRKSRSKFGIELLRIKHYLNNINIEEQNNIRKLNIHVFIIEDELNELIVSTINIYTITLPIFFFIFLSFIFYL